MKKIFIIIIATVISLLVIGYLALQIVFSGGVFGFIHNLKSAPDPTSKRISERRNEVVSDITSEFKELETFECITFFNTSTHDRCYKGSSDWKRSDGFAYRCTFRMTKYYGFNTDFKKQMTDYEQNVFSKGWRLPYNDSLAVRSILNTYYGKPGKELVSEIPPLQYEKGKYERDKKILAIDYAERLTRDLAHIEYAQEVTGSTYDSIYEVRNFQDINAIFKQVTADNKYLLYVSIQQNYFEN